MRGIGQWASEPESWGPIWDLPRKKKKKKTQNSSSFWERIGKKTESRRLDPQKPMDIENEASVGGGEEERFKSVK